MLTSAFCKEQQESNYLLANIEWGSRGGESVNCELPPGSEVPVTIVSTSTLFLPHIPSPWRCYIVERGKCQKWGEVKERDL